MSEQKNRGFIKQHIVPKCYLNGFAERGKGKDKYIIGVWQKDSKHFINSTNNIGYINNYYDIDYHDDNKKWEHYFNKELETILSKNLKRIIAKAYLSNREQSIVDDQDKTIISKFILIQLIRVPEFLESRINRAEEFIDNYLRLMVDTFSKYISKNDKNKILNLKMPKSKIKDLLLNTYTDKNRLSEYCYKLKNKLWLVYYNNTSTPFITSDNPVVLSTLAKTYKDRKYRLIDNNKTIVFLPINQKVAIGILPENFYNGCRDLDSKIYPLSEKDDRFVYKMNMALMEQCFNQCFFPLSLYNKIYNKGANL